jgi:peroxiredoxin
MKINYSSIFSHSVITTVLLIISVAINALLFWQIRQKDEQIKKLDQDYDYNLGVLPGEKLPPLTLLDNNGKPAEISYPSELPTILYVFTEDCHWCERNIESVKTLRKNTEGKYRFVGVSLKKDGLAGYIEKHQLDFEIYNSPTRNKYAAYKMAGTPQTFVISPDGYLVKMWSGAFGDRVKVEMEAFFETKLPELTEDSGTQRAAK